MSYSHGYDVAGDGDIDTGNLEPRRKREFIVVFEEAEFQEAFNSDFWASPPWS